MLCTKHETSVLRYKIIVQKNIDTYHLTTLPVLFQMLYNNIILCVTHIINF